MKSVPDPAHSAARAIRESLRPRFKSPSLIYDIEIGEFIEQAIAFEHTLTSAKGPAPFGWYPYDTVGTLSLLDRLLTGPARFLRTLVPGEPVLDLGCGDGILSFALEALGVEVHAVDNPQTNFNGMRGVKALKRAVRSSVRIHEADLDTAPAFPVKQAGLALFLGILYHLKNPFGVLEALSRCARYCLLSTAITRFAPDQQTDLRNIPAAFIAGRDGLKGDETNYWIFTEAGLKVLADRAGWEICDWLSLDDEANTLWGTQQDNRVFCLLRSRVFSANPRPQLLAGWHHLENSAWRWTKRRFSVMAPSAGSITLRCTVPPSLPCPVTLKCSGHEVRFDRPGDYDATFAVHPGAIEFEVDRWLDGDSTDGRERGLIVRSVQFD